MKGTYRELGCILMLAKCYKNESFSLGDDFLQFSYASPTVAPRLKHVSLLLEQRLQQPGFSSRMQCFQLGSIKYIQQNFRVGNLLETAVGRAGGCAKSEDI